MSNRKYSYEEHITKTVKNCCVGCIELRKSENGFETIKIVRATCKSIHCTYCSAIKARRYYNRAKAILLSGNFRFLTLTASSNDISIDSHCKHMLSSWKAFIKELKKYYPKLKYIRVIERHKSGYIHFHACLNSFIPQPQLLSIWRKYETKGFAYVISVPNEVQAKYISKYITKQEYAQDETSKSLYDNSARIFQSSLIKLANNYVAEYQFYQRHESYADYFEFLLTKENDNYFNRLIPKDISPHNATFAVITPEEYRDIYTFPV